MIAPSQCPRGPHWSAHALGQMTDADLVALADHGDCNTVRVAAQLVLIGRATAVPQHAPWAGDAADNCDRRTA